MPKRTTKQIKARLRAKTDRSGAVPDSDLLSSGSALVNLACTSRTAGAFIPGKYYIQVGGSTSGKTFLALTSLAEACRNPQYRDYALVYDNVEDGALMDWERFFGASVAARVRDPWPGGGHSRTAEEFYMAVEEHTKQGPCVYVLDSMDALDTEADAKKRKQRANARKAGKEAAGTYGTAKAKTNSDRIKNVIQNLRDNGSILIVVGQTRMNIGLDAMFNPEVYSGGTALKFYATLEMWLRRTGTVTVTYKGKKRKVGHYTRVRVKKSRMTGREREVTVPILPSVGIDDLGGCVDFLVSEGRWTAKQKSDRILAADYDLELPREKLVAYIEQEGLEDELYSIVQEVWDEIEAACEVHRKRKYE